MEDQKQKEFLSYYKPVQHRISNYCRSIIGNNEEAKDLLSETLLIAFQNFDNLKDKEKFVFYLFGIASRLFKKYLKRKTRTNYYQNPIDESKQNEKSKYEDVEFLYYLLNQLPDKQKEAVILFEINGFSIKEICKIQESSESAVKSRLKRGREKLYQLAESETKFKSLIMLLL